MATPYTPPTSISTEPLPSPTSAPYPAKTKISTDGATALTATSILLADKLMFTLVRGAAAPSSWFHAAIPATSMDPEFSPPKIGGEEEWAPDVTVDVDTLLGVGRNEDVGQFVGGLVAKKCLQNKVPVGGVLAGIGTKEVKDTEWDTVVRLIKEVVPRG